MKRGCSDDGYPSDGDRPPERDRSAKRSYVGKGKGRAKTPPRPPTPPPETSDGQGAGRCTENVVRKAVASMVSVASMVPVVKFAALSASVGALDEAFKASILRAEILQDICDLAISEADKESRAARAHENAFLVMNDDEDAQLDSYDVTGVRGPINHFYGPSRRDNLLDGSEDSCVPICPKKISVDKEGVCPADIDPKTQSPEPEMPEGDE